MAAMPPSVAAGSVNTKVAELCSLAREEAAVAGAQFRAIEMWLRLKAPAVSDGNNFGVDVQNYVIGELKSMRGAMQAGPAAAPPRRPASSKSARAHRASARGSRAEADSLPLPAVSRA